MKLIEFIDALCQLSFDQPGNPIVVMGDDGTFDKIALPYYSERMDCILITEEMREENIPFRVQGILDDLERYEIALRNVDVVAYWEDGHALITSVYYDEVSQWIVCSMEPERSPIIENNNKATATLADLQQRVERLEACQLNIHSADHKEMLNRYLNTYIATWVAYEQRSGGRLDRSYTRYTGDED